MRFWLGGYTDDLDGHAAGIGVLLSGAPEEQSPRGPLAFAGTAAHAESPSWLSAHPTQDVVYAALEGRGAVQAFRRTGPESLARLGRAVPTGDLTCHLAVAPDGSSLVAASYGDGSVTRVALSLDGMLGESVQLAQAVDPYAVDGGALFGGAAELQPRGSATIDLAAASRALREAAGSEFAHLIPSYEEPVAPIAPAQPAEDVGARISRAHHVTFLPGGRFATTDTGFDTVRIWNGQGEVQSIALPQGTAPRHAVWHPSGHLYVVTRDSCEIYALAPDRSGEWRIMTAHTIARELALGFDQPAEISQTHDGLFLHVSVRGSDTLATIAVQNGGASLSDVALVESGVDGPRHHVVIGDTVVIAGQKSDEVVSRIVDGRTGVVGHPLHRAPAPTPSMLLPLWE